MRKLLLQRAAAIAFGVGLLLTARLAFAHHSFLAEYDPQKPVTIKGTVTKMEWVNPHSWLYVDVKDPDGKVVNWGVEFGSPNALYRRGWRKEDLPIGALVTVDGYKAKNGSPIANARNVVLPNGQKLFAGSSGSGAPGDGADR